MQRALDFDKTPALGVPLPFFLNIPLFLLLAGILVTWFGADIWTSRWSGSTLALTHLWTLGVLGSAMLGALLQLLAVACNIPTPGIRHLARWVHALLTVGTLMLVSGFLWWKPAYWISATILLGLAFTIYLVVVGYGLWQHRQRVYPGAREILVPVRGALVSLAIAIVLGLSMAGALSVNSEVPGWIASHQLWGLIGWGGLLLMGMSFQLIPIFQVTDLYPAKITRWLPLWVPILLVAWSALNATEGLPPALLETVELLLLGSYLLWAFATVHLLWYRKRPDADATTLFWYASMAALIACAPAWLWMTHNPHSQAPMVLGVLIIVGVLGTVINGMLYLILPFLLWKHAQNSIVLPDGDPRQARAFQPVLPKAAQYISVTSAKLQWAVHCVMVVSWVLAAGGWQWAISAAGPLLIASALLLSWNILKALMLYRKALRAIAAVAQTQKQR